MGAKEEVLDAEVVEGEEDLDPTDLRALFFRQKRLSVEQRQEIEADLKQLVKEAHDSRADLDNLLVHWYDLAEGIAPPKSFPWPNSSNLHVPLAETKLNELHAASRSTLLRNDGMYYVRGVGRPLAPNQTAKLEQYLNYKINTLGLVGRFSDLVWTAGRDGTALAHVYHYEEYRDVQVIKTYKTLQEFLAAYPEQKDSGLTKGQYAKVLGKFADKNVKKPVVRLLETVRKCVYKGPKVDVVELADFLMAPMTSVKTQNARLVGKVMARRGPEIQAMAKDEDWNAEDVDRVLTSHDPGKQDQGTTTKDQIEGITRVHQDREKNGDFVLAHGIYRADLDGDNLEERYLVFFHYLTGTLLGITHYPYVHGQDCFVPVRIKKRPNRFLGRGFCAMLDDMNIEINTQHNQRIDSRTITTVPSFLVKQTERQNFDPSRPDKRFFPGVAFYLTDFGAVKQLDIKQTDMSETMQEEASLMSLADRLVGSTALRSGGQVQNDPRAPAAKTRMMLNASDGRLDDYFEELAGNGEEHEGLNEVGAQVLALLHQFFSDEEIIPLTRGGTLAAPELSSPAAPPMGAPGAPIVGGAPAPGGPASSAPGMAPAAPLSPQPLPLPGAAPITTALPATAAKPKEADYVTITAEDLEAVQDGVQVQLAKTSTLLNPDNAFMRFMQLYSLLAMDPLVGGNPKGRLALDRRLLDLSRTPNAEELLPPDPQTAQEWMQMQSMILQGATHQKGGRPGARNRGGAMTPSAGGAAPSGPKS